MSKTLKEIAEFLNGELIGDGSVRIKGVKSVEEAEDQDLSFIISPKYEEALAKSRASGFLIPKSVKNTYNKNVVKVASPSASFSKAVGFILPESIAHPAGISKSAIISKNAKLSATASIGHYAVIEDNAVIGDSTIIYPFVYIGKNATVGKDCIMYPGVVIREDVVINDRVIIHPNSVIGSDGFGYDTQPDGTHIKIPQIGTVVIEDDVEIGSCVTIDRARFSKTVIGKGSKIDNLVQIAHNVILGPNCILAGQAGVSGSSKLGRNVTLAGQVGVADHVTLGDFVTAGAKTGIPKSYPSGTVLFGYPGKPVDKAKEIIASTALLPKLFERVKKLEAAIEGLKKK